ncbi:MAG TPA: zf-HC2 domain-containing protein, partial [Roseiflexaceae bacterium]|nr:zf-HC2 domain-containing protein [Roseiflexaceae bacterium]
MPCYDEGQLRAFLDHALPAAEHAAVEAHLAGCAACRTYYEQQCTSTAQLGQLLAMPTAHSDPHAALARLRAGIGSTPPNNPVAVAATAAATPSPRRKPMQTTHTLPNIRRRLMAG